MDTGERFRGGVHVVAGSLAFAMCAYNLMAWGERKQRRNALNAGLYGALWAFEAFYQTPSHWTATPDAVPTTEYDGMAVVA